MEERNKLEKTLSAEVGLLILRRLFGLEVIFSSLSDSIHIFWVLSLCLFKLESVCYEFYLYNTFFNFIINNYKSFFDFDVIKNFIILLSSNKHIIYQKDKKYEYFQKVIWNPLKNLMGN